MVNTKVLRCQSHGEATRLTCVECGQPICPKCMVRTDVGLKCHQCAAPAPVPVSARLRASRLPLSLAVGGVVLVIAALVLVLRPSGSSQRTAPPLPPVGTWADVPDLPSVRGTTTAALLADGRALVSGGGVGTIALAAAELYDPKTNGWTATGALNQARRGHQAVVLRDGRVLVAGGIAEGSLLASAELFDPVAGTWSRTAPMAMPRLGHSLTLLSDGRVLAAGGTALESGAEAGGGQTIRPEASAEIYDPKSGRWAPGGAMASPRFEHTATSLGNGRVLITGGLGPGDGRVRPLASTELYDPAANAFVGSTDLSEARSNHAAALLPDGSVLIVGGVGGANGDVSLQSAEVFDSRQGSWTRAEPMAEARTGETATALADGRILVVGGESVARGSRRSLASSEVFDPARRAWRSAGAMACPRSEQASMRLADGTVLVVAGDAAFPGKAPIAQSCAGRYQP